MASCLPARSRDPLLAEHTRLRVPLQTGVLQLHSPDIATLKALTGFGSRANRKRGFIFVSKVLGKYHPCRPEAMHARQAQLAAGILERLEHDGPTLVIGFAETATGLGFGVHRALREQGLSASFYSHTTRHRLNRPLWIDFQEVHSHAPEHLLYRPQSLELLALLPEIRNLVLVDDEFSTGRTLENLARALTPHLPRLRQILGAALLSWCPTPPPNMECFSLHQGRFEFIPSHDAWEDATAQAVNPSPRPLDALLPHNFGRLGTARWEIPWRERVSFRGLRGKSVLVLGTGECMPPAYCLGRYLENEGIQVEVLATARSPLNVDGDIGNRLIFMDNYHENLRNYLYNIHHYDVILVCYETASLPGNHDLPAQLRAHADEVRAVFLSPP